MIVRCKRDRMGVIQKYFYMDKKGLVEQKTYNVFVRKCQLRAGVLVICNKRNSAITKYVSIWTHERHNGGR